MQRLANILHSNITTKVLFVLNVLIAIGIAFMVRNDLGGDSPSYLRLADGLLEGRYSSWFWLDPYIPDTFRSPGYPLFIALIFSIFHDPIAVQCVQFALYIASLWLGLRAIGKFGGTTFTRNIFLLLVVPSINLPYYTMPLFPEMLVMFCLMLIININVFRMDGNWKKAVVLGLLFGIIFQCRPTIIFFPIGYTLALWLIDRKVRFVKGHLLMLGTYFLTMLPYALWNQQAHGMFKPTPLEGGAGVVEIGYWSGRIPKYQEARYWGNFTGDEVFNMVDPKEIPANIAAFEHEWDLIDEQLEPLLTPTDSLMLAEYARIGDGVKAYNTAYTLKREELLWKYTIENIRTTPGYFVKYKLYSAFRLWVVGIQRTKFQEASFSGKVQQLYPTLFTLAQFLLALSLLIVMLWKHRATFSTNPILWLLPLYYGAIHIPFVIQNKYTTPVRMVLFIWIAFSITHLVNSRRKRSALPDHS